MAPPWLDSLGLHAQLLGRAAKTAGDTARAARRYAELLGSEPDLQLWEGALQQQIYLGDDGFVGRMQALASPQAASALDVPRIQRRAPGMGQRVTDAERRPEPGGTRPDARSMDLWRSYREEGITMTALAARCGLSVSRVSRLIAAVEAKGAKGKA